MDMNEEHVFDLIVIGTGTAASTTAHECSSAGWKVAIIDSTSFGGTCALRGCDPKKVLVEAVKVVDSAHRHQNKGVLGCDKVHIKWSDLIHFKRAFTEPFPKHREEGYKKAGMVPFHGRARFISSNQVRVQGKENNYNEKNIVLKGKKILVATGAKPMQLNIPGSANITSSDQFLEFGEDNLPNRIVFVGGGYISFEFAHIAARAGANVTILHRGKQPLEHFDPDLVNLLIQRSRDIGIDIQLQSTVEKVDKSSDDGSYVVQYSSNSSMSNNNSNNQKEKTTSRIECDMVVHGAGRVPNVEGLDLAAAGIEYVMQGIKVNEYLQSISNPSIYAAGDVAASGGPPLTPVATYEGSVVATNLIKGNVLKCNYSGLPSVVFTTPPLASVGMQENEAKQAGFRFKIKHENTVAWASSRRVGETCSGFKVLIEEDTDRILGAHIVGPHSEEVINIFSMAIRLDLTAKEIRDPLLYAYPTNVSDVVYML
jgi:glutathione reductase (NADPH)